MTPDERDEYPKRSLKGEQATDANNKIKLTFQIPSVISQSRHMKNPSMKLSSRSVSQNKGTDLKCHLRK